MQHLIVPVDGSESSWRSVDLALTLSRRTDAPLDLLEVVFREADVNQAQLRMEKLLGERDTGGVDVGLFAVSTDGTVAEAVEAFLADRPGGFVVMASHGRGRSAALVGSVAEEVLQRTSGSALVVGPNATTTGFDGPVIATVDGSDLSEAALPLAATWASELGAQLWLVQVADDSDGSRTDAAGSLYLGRLASHLADTSGYTADYDVLHGHPVDSVCDYATQLGASLIVAASHGRSGWSRLTMGSTTSGFVRHAPCPILVVRHTDTPSPSGDG